MFYSQLLFIVITSCIALLWAISIFYNLSTLKKDFFKYIFPALFLAPFFRLCLFYNKAWHDAENEI